MKGDPIVEEVRKAGQAAFREANYDLKKYFENLKRIEQQYADRLSDRKPVPYPTKKMPKRAKRKSRDAR